MLLLAQSAILPAWLVLPVAAITMLVVAAHVLATHAGDMPLRRRRLRIVNGLLMLLVTALLAYALGIAGIVEEPAANPEQTRSFVAVWLAIVGLVGLIVALAAADAIATSAAIWSARREIRRQMREGLRADLTQRRAVGPAAQGPASGRR